MAKERVASYIPEAINLIEEFKIAQDGKVPEEFNGYIASFGASIIKSGLLPAVVFYEAEDSGAKEDRKKLMLVILELVKENDNYNYDKLSKYIMKKQKTEINLKNKIKDAAVAIKLAIRSFELVEGGDDSEK